MVLIFSITILIVCPLIHSLNFNMKDKSYGTKAYLNPMDSYQLVGGKSQTRHDENFFHLFYLVNRAAKRQKRASSLFVRVCLCAFSLYTSLSLVRSKVFFYFFH